MELIKILLLKISKIDKPLVNLFRSTKTRKKNHKYTK